jgi:DNA-binding transcriptional LysR family regulator
VRLSQIRDFISIVEAGSIRAAARGRGVSQPTMTKSMRRLEEELGVRLVQRTTQGIVPTPSGRAFLARARAVQAELRKADEELAELAGERGGTAAFGVSATAALVIPDALVRFRNQHPHAYVRIVEGAVPVLLPLLRDETLDFVLGPKIPGKNDAQFRSRPLFRLPLVVAGRRGHPLRTARSLRELADAQWLLFSASGWPGAMLERAFTAAGIPRPRSLIQCESYAAAIDLLVSTDTLGLIPPQQLAEPAARGLLQEVAVTEPIPPVSFVMLARADVPLTPVAAAMAAALTAAARRLVRSG